MNQGKARAGVVNALQATRTFFIFSSSDFLFPSVMRRLSPPQVSQDWENLDMYFGWFDGDATAYQMLVDRYLDATGVQDVYFESEQSFRPW